jgi:transcriptional regulator with XRE-family HTH domain
MTLNDQIRVQIDSYLKRNKHASLNSLAKKSGVGATTIRRIQSSSIKNAPSPHTVLNIMSALTNETNLEKLISMMDGEVGEYLDDAFSLYTQTAKEHSYKTELNQALTDGLTYLIYKMTANRTGVSKLVVVEEFGKQGLKRLEKLLGQGFIIREDDQFHATEKNFSVDYKIASEHLPELVKLYRPQELNLDRNLFYTLSETISEEGIKKVKEIQKECVEKIYQIFKSPYYEGEHHYFTLNLSDTITHSELGVMQ